MADLVLPPARTPLTEGDGYATKGWRRFLDVVAKRIGTGGIDFVAQALGLAQNAVPQSTEIVTAFGIRGGGALSENLIIQLGLGDFRVAELPTASVHAWAFAIDGRKTGEGAGSGTGVWAWSDGNAWYSIMGGVVAA